MATSCGSLRMPPDPAYARCQIINANSDSNDGKKGIDDDDDELLMGHSSLVEKTQLRMGNS